MLKVGRKREESPQEVISSNKNGMNPEDNGSSLHKFNMIKGSSYQPRTHYLPPGCYRQIEESKELQEISSSERATVPEKIMDLHTYH